MTSRFVKLGAKTYEVFFGANAIYTLEKTLGISTQLFGLRMVLGQVGFSDFQTLLYAGLEGARLKRKDRKHPWTLEEVGDLIDEAGGVNVVWEQNSEVYEVLYKGLEDWAPKPRKEEEKPKDEEKGTPVEVPGGPLPNPTAPTVS